MNEKDELKERRKVYQAKWRTANPDTHKNAVNRYKRTLVWPTPRQGMSWELWESAAVMSKDEPLYAVAKRIGRSYVSCAIHRNSLKKHSHPNWEFVN